MGSDGTEHERSFHKRSAPRHPSGKEASRSPSIFKHEKEIHTNAFLPIRCFAEGKYRDLRRTTNGIHLHFDTDTSWLEVP
jgi:hypothetical protein